MSELNEAAHERVEDARIILETLGMDAERSNERSALVLLALLKLTPSESWTEAANPMLGTRAIMDAVTALVAELRHETPPPGRWDMRVGERVAPA
mgnify:CR=1 FL=1